MKTLPDVDALELDFADGWLTIWLNQPESRNALSAELSSDLRRVFAAVREDREVRGITLRGRGGVFCAGGDLKSFQSNLQSGGNRDAIVKLSCEGAELFAAVASTPQVVIVCVEGAAMAGGLGLTCCADVVIAEASARFALTETAIGLSPAQIAPYILQKLGYATGRRLMLTAARFKADEGQRLGLVDFLAEQASQIEEIEAQIKRQVLGCAPEAVAATKSLILELPRLSHEEAVKAAAENFADRMLSSEAQEGIRSFLEKRKPSWASSVGKS